MLRIVRRHLGDDNMDILLKFLLFLLIISAAFIFYIHHLDTVFTHQKIVQSLEIQREEEREFWEKTYASLEDKLEETESNLAYLQDSLNYVNKKSNMVQIASVDTSNSKVMVAQPPGSVLYMEATAYTADCEGCIGITYTGVDVRNNTPNIIAVDPDVVELGRKVELIVEGESWGIWETQDIGRDIQGFRIDILMENTQEALNFGRRNVILKILE